MARLAGAHGRPVVGTRHGGLPDVVVDGVTGLLADEGDVARLADHVLALLDDPSRAARLGAAARQRVTSAFDLATCEARLVALLTAVAEGAPLPTFVDDGPRSARSPALPPVDPEPSTGPDDDDLPSVSILIPAHRIMRRNTLTPVSPFSYNEDSMNHLFRSVR